MWKILIGILLFISFHTQAVSCSTTSGHLRELRSRYPYGLLSDDFGVLTINDLALNACRIKPIPLVPGALNPYEYWICFESKAILAICEDQNFSNEDGRVGRVIIEAHNDEGSYQFIESRPWPIRDCIGFVKAVENLIQGTTHSCISSSYIDRDKKEYMGIFHRIKTAKGCEGEECILTDRIKKENCPDSDVAK